MFTAFSKKRGSVKGSLMKALPSSSMSYEGGAASAAGLTALSDAYRSMAPEDVQPLPSPSPEKKARSADKTEKEEAKEAKAFDLGSARSHALGPLQQQSGAWLTKMKARIRELAKLMAEANREQQMEEAFVVAAQRLQLLILWSNVEPTLKSREVKGKEAGKKEDFQFYDELVDCSLQKCTTEESRFRYLYVLTCIEQNV